MFKIESYVTPILLSYVDKYVRDFKPVDAQVSLWAGGVALHNLVLKADVLQQELALPFTLVSGRIHELLIQVPWTKIMSEPIVVTIDTIECVLTINPTPTTDDTPSESPSRKTQVVEAPPGYMQALVRRIVSNIALRVHHLIVKYVQDDIVLSLNVKHLAVDSAGPNWQPSFADIDQVQPMIRRLMRLDDLTLCLDRADSDGKIRVYQEPLLYRCQLDLRILTRLVSASTRRAVSLGVQVRSSRLAWGVSGDQLALLLRLLRERMPRVAADPPTPTPAPAPKLSDANAQRALHATSANSAEPARQESWSEWAWSWLPAWADRDTGAEEATAPTAPLPLHFNGYFDEVSLVIKVMETEGNNRKRARGILELNASHTAFKSSVCKPTTFRIQCGIRDFTVQSKGKCVCGHIDYYTALDEPTVYLCKRDESAEVAEWQWPEDQLSAVVETARAVDEQYRSTPELDELSVGIIEAQSYTDQSADPSEEMKADQREETDELWKKMEPQFYVEFTHERSPPEPYTNPYENPPKDFQYSDWVEECNMKIILEASEIRVCMGLLHRLNVLRTVFKDLPPVPTRDLPLRTLTVEECEALGDNLPQRRVSMEARGLRIQVVPWDHVANERGGKPPLLLLLDMPKNSLIINGPLYPHRVCAAACQMPTDSGSLWAGARVHATLGVSGVQASVQESVQASMQASMQASVQDAVRRALARPVARADLVAVGHLLLHRNYFVKRESVCVSYSVKIREVNICGSSARVQAAWQILASILAQNYSEKLRFTTLARDALNDDESVAIDLTVEDLIVRGYFTRNIITHIIKLQSAKATALHETRGGQAKQAWLFSLPDTPTSSPYLRVAVQWCRQRVRSAAEYAGMWTEPAALALDPLLAAWLAYKPSLRPTESISAMNLLKSSSSLYFKKRSTAPSSSSGRGVSKSGSATELVHSKPRSMGSSEKADKEAKQAPVQENFFDLFWSDENLLKIHERLCRMLVNMEIGLTLLYITMTTASAVDCATLRDAMERHASDSQRVLGLSLGRLSMNSSTLKRNFWPDIAHDGPTFITPKPDQEDADMFPWRIRLSDVSCYILEGGGGAASGSVGRESPLRSQLKTASVAAPRTVLELVTTAVTLSVVTKSVTVKPPLRSSAKPAAAQDEKLKYFTRGSSKDFRPSNLKEFFRGPASKKKKDAKQSPEQPTEKKPDKPAMLVQSGPIISLGVNMHADTPPLVIRLDQDQVHIIAAAAHCITHIVALLTRPPLVIPDKLHRPAMTSQQTLIRSVSELDETQTPSDETASEDRSELISIYEANSMRNINSCMKKFFWCQWVVSHISIVAATDQVKLALDVDDIISSMDLQSHYNQFKIKVASASVRHYERSGSEEWRAGVLCGRVLEAREPANSKEDNHFLTVTVTQAQICNLPAAWKEELHPKLLERKTSLDTMWEVYAKLAPLEAVIEPKVLEHIISLVVEMAPRAYCPLNKEKDSDLLLTQLDDWQWPFIYVTAGGLRLLLTAEVDTERGDDTFVIVIGKVVVNPHPENPICRRSVNVAGEGGGWAPAGGGGEGRQYSIVVNNLGIRSAKFYQLVKHESSEVQLQQGTAGENPAVKWTNPTRAPTITPVLHVIDIECVVAPALYINEVLTCGPAVEVNVVNDCVVEVSLDQLALANTLAHCALACIRMSQEEAMLFDEEKHGMCPYATLLMEQDPENVYDSNISFGDKDSSSDLLFPTVAEDSGVDSGAPSTVKQTPRVPPDVSIKKGVMFAESFVVPGEHLEVFVTLGVIEVSLYATEDGSPELLALRPPLHWERSLPASDITLTKEEPKKASTGGSVSAAGTKSLTETIQRDDPAKHKLDLPNIYPSARKGEGNLPLLHVTLQQPNLYFWRKKSQKSVQISLFDAWVGLGAGLLVDHWSAVLLSTAMGQPDPVTDIRPALATLKIVMPANATSASNPGTRGSIKLDIERPLLLEVSYDRLRRLKSIVKLINQRTVNASRLELHILPPHNLSPFYKFKKILVERGVETVRVTTSQVAVCGSQGAAGWEALALQAAAGARPERLAARLLLSAASLAAGPHSADRHPLVQPLVLGVELDASWEAWRRAEGGISAREPTVRISLEMDCVNIDLRPKDLEIIEHINNALIDLGEIHMPSSDSVLSNKFNLDRTASKASVVNFEPRLSVVSFDNADDHFYKDDLRSGAFKIVGGGQLPMAYQVTLHNNAVSWRYPHPRAITRLVAFPLPGQDEETPCVLELYNQVLRRWEVHTYFALPVGEPREMQLYVPSPECVFAVMWRYRVYEGDDPVPPFEFDIKKFLPRDDPLLVEPVPEQRVPPAACGVTAEQLSGVVRVDSCFSPRLAPRLRLAVRLTQFNLHLHNDLPPVSSGRRTSLEGYYVSRPLMLSHRAVSIRIDDLLAHVHLASPAGSLLILHTTLSSDIVECATGTMERLVEEFRVQCAVSVPAAGGAVRARAAAGRVHAALHVPRLRTLHALAHDWTDSLTQHIIHPSTYGVLLPRYMVRHRDEPEDFSVEGLEGRVSLWIHNGCAMALRIGQEETDEVMPLGPGATLAYRWCCPTSIKQIRFAPAGPAADWYWSTGIPFIEGKYKVRLQREASACGPGGGGGGGGAFLYTRVRDEGARRTLLVSARLSVANMLRNNMLFNVRARSESKSWATVYSGEMSAESVGLSVVCDADCDMALKIKFAGGEAGWSGDIPLKECPKENLPWLVKVPTSSAPGYACVWCRVVRARSDGRVLATLWPLYVLYSNLPLDVDVLIFTDTESPGGGGGGGPLVQAAGGRGACTHLLPPGTTTARHTLSFQYRNIDCPVTKEAVPLHYGVTDTSVFDKRAPINSLDEVIEETYQWLERSGRDAKSNWPYSIVAKHWPSKWTHATLQPRCDVTVRYGAVRAGGGCALEARLSPAALACNATDAALTLRAHDAAPLCRLEPGAAVAPPDSVLQKPFFISVETGKETFVSEELHLSTAVLGRYETPPPGRIVLDRPTEIAIQCNQKVTLLTLYYEIKEDINILGLSSTYLVINRLDIDIMVAPVAVPADIDNDVVLHPTTYQFVHPTREGSVGGLPLCRFSAARAGRAGRAGRWRGGEAPAHKLFLCVGFPSCPAAPVRLARAPRRRPMSLRDGANGYVPIVVSQVKHEGRWIVTIAKDPCPQLFVHNRTQTPIMVAQPSSNTDEPSTSKITVWADCEGARWSCIVQPGAALHYSTPGYCLRHPPTDAAPTDTVTFLTFAKYIEEAEAEEAEWSPAVALAEGEQLVQLAGAGTVKLRVRTHPHSTLIELRDVDQSDLAASDVRRRLLGAYYSEEIVKPLATTVTPSTTGLSRTQADDKLLEQSATSHMTELKLEVLDELIPPDTCLKASLSREPTREIFKAPDAFTTPIVESKSKEKAAGVVTPSADLDENADAASHDGRRDRRDSTLVLFLKSSTRVLEDNTSKLVLPHSEDYPDSIMDNVSLLQEVPENEWEESGTWTMSERLRVVASGVAVELAAAADTKPLVALQLDRVALLVRSDARKTKTTLTIADMQVDNLQYESGQFDFAVVAATRGERSDEHSGEHAWPPLWNMFAARRTFAARQRDARLLLRLTHDMWTVAACKYTELTEVECRAGPVALYVEDEYVRALSRLWRAHELRPRGAERALLAEERALRHPVRLRLLHVHPLALTLTLHTAVRMYIALDQSPLNLSAFKLHDTMTSVERLTHALTVHYLSAAILGAGWVVGGLELLGAPGAVAARVAEARGGVRGVAAAAGAALLRALSAAAASLARNLDLLHGDTEHAQRAAAARRDPPASLLAGLIAGLTNFAINILGAVGGLAHHPLVGMAVGETESGATALRRGLIGAFAKPLSATADLVAYAGHGLLNQTGWDPAPQARSTWSSRSELDAGWRRDCVRWAFRLAEMPTLAGFHVLMDGAALLLLFTHKYLVVADPDSERIVEMIDFRNCSVGPYQGQIIELTVTQRRQSKLSENRAADDEENEIAAAAMARVARYTGAAGAAASAPSRALALLPAPRRALALHAALLAALHHNSDAYFPLR